MEIWVGPIILPLAPRASRNQPATIGADEETTVTQKPGRVRLNLDVVLFREDDYWVGHCIQLGIATSGRDLNKVFEDACQLCKGQVEYAMAHDPECKNLFRPADPELLELMAKARVDGCVDLEVNSLVHSPEVQVTRRSAA